MTTRDQKLRELVFKLRDREIRRSKTDEYQNGIAMGSEWAADELTSILNEEVEVSSELDPADIVTEMYPPDPGGMRSYMPRGVKITHKPTGLSVACVHDRSQHMNRDIALRAITAALKEAGK